MIIPDIYSEEFVYLQHMEIRLKNYTGQTFSSLIQNIRLSRAAEMLKQPDRSVTAVMEEIGYSNITHFYKIFEKKFHMTPAEYRNTL